jgi:hypothetical protein
MDDEQLMEALTYNPRLLAQGERRRQRNEDARDPSDMAEIVAGFHPVLGPAISAKDFKESYEKDDKVGMGLAALGMLPIAGGVVKPIAKALAKPTYEVFKDIPNATTFFKTSRMPDKPSLYAHLDDTTTQAFREPSNRSGTGYAMQPRSAKTIYVEPKDSNNIGGYLHNTDMATKIVPEMDKNGKATGKMFVELMEDWGPRKAGEKLYVASYKTKPEAGLRPMEIYNAESKVGSTGGVHFGSDITEVVSKPPAGQYAQGGAIKMPDNYSNGSWKLI